MPTAKLEITRFSTMTHAVARALLLEVHNTRTFHFGRPSPGRRAAASGGSLGGLHKQVQVAFVGDEKYRGTREEADHLRAQESRPS